MKQVTRTVPFSDLPEGASFTSPHDTGEPEGTRYTKARPPFYRHEGNEIPPNATIDDNHSLYARFGPAAPVCPVCPYCGSSNIDPSGPGGLPFCRDCETQIDPEGDG